MQPLRIAFFGTPEFAVPTLREIRSRGHEVVAVVTQPDRPRGRGQKPSPGPVKSFAGGHGLPVLQPDRIRDAGFLAEFAALSPEIGVVAAYGRILPAALLQLPRHGFVNVHASILPRWRGASPIHRAVMAGDAETGVSIMRVVEALDAGGVFAAERRPIAPDETSEEVERDLAERGARLILPVLDSIAAGTAREVPQDDALATYAPRLTRDEGAIDWSMPAAAIHNRVRGLHPWPHAFTSFRGARLIVLRSSLEAPKAGAATRPGEILSIGGGVLVVAAGDGRPIALLRLQAEGRKPLGAREFAAGARLRPGERFGG